jgi:hypothetical protein
MTCTQAIASASGWVGFDLAGHDRAAPLVGRQAQLAETGVGAAGQQPQVVGDPQQRDRGRRQRAVRGDHRVVCPDQGEPVGGRLEGQPAVVGEFARDRHAEPRWRVQDGAHRGAADRQGHQVGQGRHQGPSGAFDLARPPAERLAERHRHGILQVGAADLHHRAECLLALAQRPCQRVQRGCDAALDRDRERALRLRAPRPVGGHGDLTEGVVFDAHADGRVERRQLCRHGQGPLAAAATAARRSARRGAERHRCEHRARCRPPAPLQPAGAAYGPCPGNRRAHAEPRRVPATFSVRARSPPAAAGRLHPHARPTTRRRRR